MTGLPDSPPPMAQSESTNGLLVEQCRAFMAANPGMDIVMDIGGRRYLSHTYRVVGMAPATVNPAQHHAYYEWWLVWFEVGFWVTSEATLRFTFARPDDPKMN